MRRLSDYQILSKIYESANSEVYRAIRQIDSLQVILKVLKPNYPTPNELTRYKQEYKLTSSLNLEGVIKAYSLEKHQNTLVIILEDFGGESLKKLMQHHQFSLCDFLSIAIKISTSLGQIHAAHIIHKDINPSNLVYCLETKQIKVIDFGISTRLTRENPILKNPNLLEGTLAYISPEQTGRMNRSLDYRTDFYSLGITFYEMLTQKLPFKTEDDLELIHCHIAKSPILPQKINPSIPPIISDIVMKLMAKNAEDRYQSAWGLTADLEICVSQLQSKGNINNFPLGSQDISDKFQIPQKLYGRESEIQALIAAFERVTKHSELMLITGYSGIGKSALVQEIYKPITEKRGYFISGKFDQFQRNIPYSAMVSAFKGLIQQLLRETPAEIDRWQEKFLAVLGVNGQVIIDVIPEVELIIGKQSPVTPLDPTESQNRFNLVFQTFIRTCCTKEHPLVIFLDDLQWADGATLNLIKLMVTDINLQYLFAIGAYRDNEVNLSHPLAIMLDELRKAEVIINQITLTNLGIEEISQLIADTLKTNTARVISLAELVLNKTGGNPFFVNQFVNFLYADDLISFTYSEQKWEWNQAQIEAQNITDNVVELMIGKLKKLPPKTQCILQLAACVGAHFDLNTLSIIEEKYPQEIFTDLLTAVESGLVLSLSGFNEQLLIENYQFLHDRIQQAAYSLIPDNKKQGNHLKIARLLLRKASEAEREENIFAIVNQLNMGRSLITQAKEREQLVQLNLAAARKAKNSTAYGAAIQYLEIAIELLPKNSWQFQPDLTRTVYEEAAEAAYLNTNYEQMEELVARVLSHTDSLIEKIRVYEIKMLGAKAQSQLMKPIEIGLQLLQLLGIEFPAQPTTADIEQALQQSLQLWQERSIPSLLDAPVMTNPVTLVTMRILTQMVSSAYQAAPMLMPLLIIKQIDLLIAEGNCAVSAFSYADYGLILCGILGDLDRGYQFGKLALNMLDLFNTKAYKSRTYYVFYTYIRHWKKSLRSQLSSFQEAYQIGLETGDLECSALNAATYCTYSYFAGNELPDVAAEMEIYRHNILQLKQESSFNYQGVYQQTVLNLLGNSADPCQLVGEAYNEILMLPILQQCNNRTVIYHFYYNKTVLCYLFGQYQQAAYYAELVEYYADSMIGMFVVTLFYFYSSLIYLKLYSSISDREQKKYLEKVANNQKKLKLWADSAPINHQHKWYLVEAEKHRVLGNKADAIEMYDRAIAIAKENQFLQDEALANELAAQFYLQWGKEIIARIYMVEARYSYLRWGATAKIKQLDGEYVLLFHSLGNEVGDRQKNVRTYNLDRDSISSSDAAIDLTTVMKSSQAIASEIVLENLLQTLMKILLENAGAQSGCLLLYTPTVSERVGIFSSATCSGTQPTTESLTKTIDRTLPESILNYVARTHNCVLLDNAAKSGNFVYDAYIQSVKPLSILCYPLLNQGKLVGIVYLENNITTGAFTTNRIELLQLLSGQAAIAITNAQLYNQEKEKSQALQRMNSIVMAQQEAELDGILIVDENRKIVSYNRRFTEVWGIPDEIIETGDDGAMLDFVIEQLSDPEEFIATVEYLYTHPNETQKTDLIFRDGRVLERYSAPVISETGAYYGRIWCFRDISDRKQVEKILTDYNRTLEQQVADRTVELQRANQELSRLVNLDGLTQVANRRRFDYYLAREWQRHLREQQPLALILMDIDYFKRYNDHYGHQRGDDCLIQVAQAIAKIPKRPTDLVARYGGEEFVAILPNTNAEGALIVAESIRMAIAAIAIPHPKSEVNPYLTLSLGVTSLIPSLDMRLEDLIANADRALYLAKNQGRDRAIVVIHPQHCPQTFKC